MYEVYNNILPKYHLSLLLSAHLLTRAVCREQDGVLCHVGRQGGQRAGIQTWSGTRVMHVSGARDKGS